MCHTTNLMSRQMDLLTLFFLLVYLYRKNTLRVQAFVQANHWSFEETTCPREQLQRMESGTPGTELASLQPSEPHSSPAQAPCLSQLFFFILHVGTRLIRLELERHRWYQGSVSKYTSCCKPWNFGWCFQNSSVNTSCNGK